MHSPPDPSCSCRANPVSYRPLPTLDINIGCSPRAVRAGLHQVVGILSMMNLRADAIKAIELVLAEALNNIVEHSFAQMAPTDVDAIRLVGTFYRGALHFRILDRGREIPSDRRPPKPPFRPPIDPTNLPEGGFGLMLIHSLAAQVRYRRIDGTNQLDLCMAAPRIC